jgi:hypothetical protein
MSESEKEGVDQTLSRDATHSTYADGGPINPDDDNPPSGPSTEQTLNAPVPAEGSLDPQSPDESSGSQTDPVTPLPDTGTRSRRSTSRES